MADYKVLPGPLSGHECVKNAVCVNTSQIYDSCRSKECIDDLRVYLTACGQAVLDRAVSIRAKKCEILCTQLDVEQVPFNKGFYSIDTKFFFRCVFDVFCGCGNPQTVEGLACYAKRTILFGSEGSAKIFSSNYKADDFDAQAIMKTNLPRAVIEVVDPIALSCKVSDGGGCCNGEMDISGIGNNICSCFGDSFVDGAGKNKLYITIGLFSVLRLERDAQLLIPSYDYYLPQKECCCGAEEDPCDFFSRISFPAEEFSPPQIYNMKTDSPCEQKSCECRK